ncbi:hypothetical protein NECAME_03137 [Necator americanus]|uniref:Uncharacterized protein n=1 Tax=Necator americanus TaxID=51031 RepID=W2T8F3_NECAM|nr:hypothetical protein NECAME_03137 [Necator americanus]ETN77476.1 hypothetical protein NECAME_03137 [Necator americanus]
MTVGLRHATMNGNMQNADFWLDSEVTQHPPVVTNRENIRVSSATYQTAKSGYGKSVNRRRRSH